MATAREIVDDIETHVTDRTPNRRRSDWYAGIAADADTRLFNDHKVSKQNGKWICLKASSADVARVAEKALHKLGFDGGPGGGGGDTVFVYAYLKASYTIE